MTEPRWRVEHGDAREVLAELPERCVQTCVTSPPYWGLRDYGLRPLVWGGRPGCRHRWGEPQRGRRADLLPASTSRAQARVSCDDRQARAGQHGGHVCRLCDAWQGSLGLEDSPSRYVEHIVEVMRAVRRVLRDDGTLWLVLGDTFAARSYEVRNAESPKGASGEVTGVPAGVKPKDLLGIPWQVAFALRADGWRLRSDVVWAKPNPIPESVRDRPTRAHEYIFLLTKRAHYLYDQHAIRESDCGRPSGTGYARSKRLTYRGIPRGRSAEWTSRAGRNRRSVWCIPTRGCPTGHIAAFPERIAEPCMLAGTSPRCCGICGAPWHRHKGDLHPGCQHLNTEGRCLVLDPFCGSGTVGIVACRHGRAFLGIDLSSRSVKRARQRIAEQTGDGPGAREQTP